ncbi:P1 family peptidase [Anaerosolibacter sp.]|uniref:DmpA family aminopeptidase n=1 Tax=Anaerosolibacter sp. TaxID=1872527 RepID=UPI0039EEAABA
MKGQKRIRDYGITIGKMMPGKKNAITDVYGVKVGHCTIKDGGIQTGVTAVLPHGGNLFEQKVMAAVYVINGFGKSIGTVQIEELGTMETPIILTNTLSVGTAGDALVEYMLQHNGDIGITTGTVNPVVCECNDGYLNDIRGRHVKKEHVFQAIQGAQQDFEEGGVGAGTGMSCYGLKGGIGTASRMIPLGEKEYTLGALVLSNFGRMEDLIVDGVKAGSIIVDVEKERETEKGSIIMVVATDIPLSERQLKRTLKRTTVALSRTGSYIGNGSGDIAIGFTTGNVVQHYEKEPIVTIGMLSEDKIDGVFRAVVEATEEAILNSMVCAEPTTGRAGHTRACLKEYMDEIMKVKAQM